MQQRDLREEPAPDRDGLLHQRLSTAERRDWSALEQNRGQPADDLHHQRVGFLAENRVQRRAADQQIARLPLGVEVVGSRGERDRLEALVVAVRRVVIVQREAGLEVRLHLRVQLRHDRRFRRGLHALSQNSAVVAELLLERLRSDPAETPTVDRRERQEVGEGRFLHVLAVLENELVEEGEDLRGNRATDQREFHAKTFGG